MFLFTILSALICVQLITVAFSAPSEQLDPILQFEPYAPNEDLSSSGSDEESDYLRRSNSFLRFGRQLPSVSGSFLRFGRQIPSVSGSFLRFGRQIPSVSGSFLRFGRRALHLLPSNSQRFARKGEFLRFG